MFSSGLAECRFQDYQIDTGQQVPKLFRLKGFLSSVGLEGCVRQSRFWWTLLHLLASQQA